MSIYGKKEDISKHLPRAFYLFGVETSWEAIQFSYFLGIIKVLIARLLNKKDKMLAVDV